MTVRSMLERDEAALAAARKSWRFRRRVKRLLLVWFLIALVSAEAGELVWFRYRAPRTDIAGRCQGARRAHRNRSACDFASSDNCHDGLPAQSSPEPTTVGKNSCIARRTVPGSYRQSLATPNWTRAWLGLSTVAALAAEAGTGDPGAYGWGSGSGPVYQGEYAPIAFDGMALAYEYPVYTGRAVSAMPRNSDLAHAHGRLIELGLVSGSPMGAGDFSAQFLNNAARP